MNITMLFWRGQLGGCFVLVVVLLALLTPSSAEAQWLEETIFLPDSFGGLVFPSCMAVDTAHSRVYFSGGKEGLDAEDGTDAYYNFVVAIDAASGAKVARVSVPHHVQLLCMNPVSNVLYCGHSSLDALSIIDCTTDSLVVTFDIPGGPRAACFNPRRNKLYVLSRSDSSVYVVDGVSNEVLATIPVTLRPEGLTYGETPDKVYCWTAQGLVNVIDGQGDSVLAVVDLENRNIRDACWNPLEDRLYCLADGYRTILTALDGFGDTIVAQVDVGKVTWGICYNPTNNRVYCASARDSIWVVDCGSDTVVSRLATPEDFMPGQVVCSPQSNRVYCIAGQEDPGFDKLLVIDTDGGDSVLGTLPTGMFPYALGYDPVQDRAYTIDYRADAVTVVDCAGDSVLNTFALGIRPRTLCYASVENKVYCGGRAYEQVIAIDGATHRVLAEIPVGYRVADLCYNPTVGKVYSVDYGSDSVSVIDCATDSLLCRIEVGSSPRYLMYSPDAESVVFVTCEESQYIYVIDCVGDSVKARVATGGMAGMRDMVPNARDGVAYLTLEGGLLKVFDYVGSRMVRSLRSVSHVYPLEYNPQDNKLYMSSFPLAIIDPTADSVIRTIDTLGRSWSDGCYNSRDNKLYFEGDYPLMPDIIMVLDGAADTVVTILWDLQGTDMLVSAMHYDPVGNKVYIVMYNNMVGVLDGRTDSVLALIPSPGNPYALAWDSVRSRMYVAHRYGSSITVIRDSVVPGVAENPGPPAPKPTQPTIVNRGRPLVWREPAALLDVSGRKLMDLVPGERRVLNLPTGLYFICPQQGGRTTRLILVD